jgi:hypothetical protein
VPLALQQVASLRMAKGAAPCGGGRPSCVLSLGRQAADELDEVVDDELLAPDVAGAFAAPFLLLLEPPSEEGDVVECAAGVELLDAERESVR